MTAVEAILAIDEGTKGTRAAWITADGETHALQYRELGISAPAPGVVEQDADEILAKTLDACRTVVGQARSEGVTLRALSISAQRATAVLWDMKTGHAIVPAMVWQDTRHAEELVRLGTEWDERLSATVGRPAGVRSPYLWATHHLRNNADVRAAYRENRLGFGTIESWLVWSISKEHTLLTTATHATSAGAYILEMHEYHLGWINALDLPADLLPPLIWREAFVAGLSSLVEMFTSRPVIATVYELGKMPEFVTGPAPIGILANIPLIELEKCVNRALEAGKFVFVNLDSCGGLAQDRGGVEFLKKIGAPGIVSTHGSLISCGNAAQLVTMQKVFITDRSTLPRSISAVRSSRPDFVQLMPWPVLPYIPRAEITELSPLIAGGFVGSGGDVASALRAGALVVSTSDARLWNLNRRDITA